MMKHLSDGTNIFLSGFMGTGKSTIGRLLADKLECSFMDLDDYVEKKEGKSIPDIFEESGEKGFRDLEKQVLLEVCKEFEGVVALGGGSLQNQHLVDHLKLNGILVFLKTPFPIILDRICKDVNRPLLLDEEGNPKDREKLRRELKLLYEKRLPLYEQAPIILKTGGDKTPEQEAEILINKIRNHVA